MEKGTIKWFDSAKGFGFIAKEDGGADVFMHYSSIEMEGFKTVIEGTPVQFDLIEGAKGLQAENVKRV